MALKGSYKTFYLFLFFVHITLIFLIIILFFSQRLNRLVDSLLTSGSSPLVSALPTALLHPHLIPFDRYHGLGLASCTQLCLFAPPHSHQQRMCHKMARLARLHLFNVAECGACI